jgi:hypothetical protein
MKYGKRFQILDVPLPRWNKTCTKRLAAASLPR